MISKTQGKRVATLHYAYKGPIQGDPQDEPTDEGTPPKLPLVRDLKVEVKVFLVQDLKETDTPPHTAKSVEFALECEAPEFKLIGTDIELLRKEAFARCDEHYATKWGKYFLVEVRKSYHGSEGAGTGMDLVYRDVHKGTAWDGTLLLKEEHWRHGHAVKITAWPGEFRTQNNRVIACIEATPANQAALEEFTVRVDALRVRIAALLEPDTILQTLANLSQNALLPPADPPKPKAEPTAVSPS